MGRGAAYDLVRNDDVEQVIVADIDAGRAGELSKELGSKAIAKRVDAKNRGRLESIFSKVDSVVSCVSYTVNLLHTEVAIETGTNLCDLGGNQHIVKKQLALHDKAKDAGITVVPDCGLAPGLTNVLTRAGIENLDTVDSVHIRVGGLQQDPLPPLNYALLFAVEGLINEYTEPCMVLRDGKITFEEPLIEFESISFPAPFNHLEAFNTSGGSSTLPLTYEGIVKDLDYKTVRYPGHGSTMWCLRQLGLMDSDEHDINGIRIAPRAVFEHLLERNLPESGKDVTLARVQIKGCKGAEEKVIEYEVVDYFDDSTGLTAMMRTTAWPQAVTAVMMTDGTITEKGVLPPERSIPVKPFIEALGKRGIEIIHCSN
jgi:lysine 6-dehydrogenase